MEEAAHWNPGITDSSEELYDLPFSALNVHSFLSYQVVLLTSECVCTLEFLFHIPLFYENTLPHIFIINPLKFFLSNQIENKEQLSQMHADFQISVNKYHTYCPVQQLKRLIQLFVRSNADTFLQQKVQETKTWSNVT